MSSAACPSRREGRVVDPRTAPVGTRDGGRRARSSTVPDPPLPHHACGAEDVAARPTRHPSVPSDRRPDPRIRNRGGRRRGGGALGPLGRCGLATA